MFGIRGNSWKDADEYKRARWAYEGQGWSATKAAWALGAGLVAMTGFAAIQKIDNHHWETMGNLRWVILETNRTTGDTVSVSMTDGVLAASETRKRQFIRYWLELWRAVPADEVAYNKSYATAQVYMNDTVFAAVDQHVLAHPVPAFIKSGGARMVQIKNVTPSGDGVRYTIDWEEHTFKNSKLASSIPMTANIDLLEYTPKDAAEAEVNMFGFLIKGFYWAPPPNAG